MTPTFRAAVPTWGRRVTVVFVGGFLALSGAIGVDPGSIGEASPRTGIEEAGPTTAHHPDGTPARGSDLRARALISHTGFDTGEPTLGVRRDGSVFTVAYQTSFAIDILRSDNRGRSWDVVSPELPAGVNRHVVSVDPYMYVDGPGRIFTIDLTVACSYLSFSDDGGAAWTTNPLACGRPVNDHQSLFAGPPADSETQGYPNAVYYCFNDALMSQCSKSLDGGMTFFLTAAPAFERGCGGLHGHGVVGPKGEVLLPMSRCGEPYLAISRDEGDSWRRVRIARNGSYPDPSVAIDDRGTIYYAWQAENRLPYIATSRDGGRSWSEPMMIAAPGVRAVNLFTIDVARPGRVGYSYMATTNTSPTNMAWYGYIGMSEDIFVRRPVFHTARVAPENQPLKRGQCGPMRCGDDILDFIDVAMDPSGMPWATFVDACPGACDEEDRSSEGLVAFLTR